MAQMIIWTCPHCLDTSADVFERRNCPSLIGPVVFDSEGLVAEYSRTMQEASSLAVPDGGVGFVCGNCNSEFLTPEAVEVFEDSDLAHDVELFDVPVRHTRETIRRHALFGQAVTQRQVLTFRYKECVRLAEPHIYGRDWRNNRVLLSYQLWTDDHLNHDVGWRLYHTSRIKEVRLLPVRALVGRPVPRDQVEKVGYIYQTVQPFTFDDAT